MGNLSMMEHTDPIGYAMQTGHATCHERDHQELALLQAAQTWNTVPPTQPGWYWYRPYEGFEEVVKVFPYPGSPPELCVAWVNETVWRFLSGVDSRTEWAGPIPIPPEGEA